MKILVAVLTFLLTVVGQAAPVCVDGVCYPSEEAARADGVSEAKLKAALAEHVDEAGNATQATGMPSTTDEVSGKGRVRVAVGYMKAPQMVAFLRNEPAAKELADHALWIILLLVLGGGLAANLTPCVLPLVPVKPTTVISAAGLPKNSRLTSASASRLSATRI